MKVRATQKGFHMRLQEVGDTFDVSPALFSSKWMEKLDEPSGEREKDRREELEAMSVADLRALAKAADGPPEITEAKGKSARTPIIDWLLGVKGETDV